MRNTVLSIPLMPLVETNGSRTALPVSMAVSPYQVMKIPLKPPAKVFPPPMEAMMSGCANSAATPAMSAASISVMTAGTRL